jgi:hypothetical protein
MSKLIEKIQSIKELLESVTDTLNGILADNADTEKPLSQWGELIKSIAQSTVVPNYVKPACLAQAIIETGRGTSKLFKDTNNAHGMKWRDEMQGYAKKVMIKVPSEPSETAFCSFDSVTAAVNGYMRFVGRTPYHGWTLTKTAKEYLRHICPTWAADPKYLEKCFSVLDEAKSLLKQNGWVEDVAEPLQPAMPTVDETKNSPNKSDRGAGISHIILHNTAGSFAGAVSWLCDPASKVSAHLVISRTGKTAQLVPFAQKAWHAGNARYNANSIGIEIEATAAQRGMMRIQEQSVIEWCKYLMHKYNIPSSNVLVHRMVGSTTCPVFIWATNEDFYEWRKNNLGG